MKTFFFGAIAASLAQVFPSFEPAYAATFNLSFTGTIRSDISSDTFGVLPPEFRDGSVSGTITYDAGTVVSQVVDPGVSAGEQGTFYSLQSSDANSVELTFGGTQLRTSLDTVRVSNSGEATGDNIAFFGPSIPIPTNSGAELPANWQITFQDFSFSGSGDFISQAEELPTTATDIDLGLATLNNGFVRGLLRNTNGEFDNPAQLGTYASVFEIESFTVNSANPSDPFFFDPRLLLATVAEASAGEEGEGRAFGNFVQRKIDQRNQITEELERCLEVTAVCDVQALEDRRVAEQQADLDATKDVIIEVGVPVVTAPIGMASVDRTFVETTKLGQFIEFAEIAEKIKTFVDVGLGILRFRDSIEPDEPEDEIDDLAPLALRSTGNSSFDFFASTASLNTLSQHSIHSAFDTEVLIKDGQALWDNDDKTSWSLFDLTIEALVDADTFPDVFAGDVFGSTGSLIDGGIGFGNFFVQGVSEEGGKRRLALSFQQVEYYEDPLVSQGSLTPVPVPGSLPILLTGLLGFGVLRLKKKQVS